MDDAVKAAIGRHVRIGVGMDLCMSCGQMFSIDGVLGCECDGMNLAKASEDGVMLALFPSMEMAEQLRLSNAGAEMADDLHLTLCYLGKASTIDPDALSRVLAAMPTLAADTPLILGRIGGIGRFPAEDDKVPVWWPVDSPEIWDLRVRLTAMLDALGVPYAKDHGFIPHMTAGYFAEPVPDIRPLPDMAINFAGITLAVGSRRISWVFGGATNPAGLVLRGVDCLDATTGMVAASLVHDAIEESTTKAGDWARLSDLPDLLGAVEKFARFDQRAVNYRPMDTDSCSGCAYFDPDEEACLLVSGEDIRPDYVCDLWTERDIAPEPSMLSRLLDAGRGMLGDTEDVYEESAPLSKAVTEDRFTLAPLYIPDRLDAHKEWTDTGTLAKAFEDFMATGDKSLRLQHQRSIVAGTITQGVVWPYESEVELSLPGGEVKKVTLPANTPYMGVVWREWAWDLVQKGKLRGFSLGGRAKRVLADLGD